MDVNVQAEASEKQPREAADEEQPDEAQGIDHGRIPGDRAFVERRSPVKNFDGRGNRHEVAKERKRKRRIGGLARHKHVMGPNQEADDGDGDARTGDEGVSKDGLARESRNDLADYAHRRKNHDVHGGMRIEPEQVLEEDGVPAEGRVEKAEMKHALEAGKQQGDGDDRRSQNHDEAGSVVRPDEEREPEPGHSGARMVWMVTMKLRPV